MKKILFILLCLCLFGCQDYKDKTPKQESKKELSSLQLSQRGNVGIWGGEGNENGYYTIHTTNEDMLYITYYDYQTLQEIALCQKPECQHKDTSCSAFIEGSPPFICTYGNYVYFIENNGFAFNALGEKSQVARITQMNLDGSHRQTLFEAENGYEFHTRDICFDDENIYVVMYKNERIETNLDYMLAVTKDEYLYKINIETKEVTKLMDMSHKVIKGVDGRMIIFEELVYKEDPQTYIDKKDFKGYEHIMKNGELYNGTIHVDTLEVKSKKSKNEDGGSYYKNKYYYMKDNILYCFDLKSEKEEKIMSFPKGIYGDNGRSSFIDDYYIIDEWKDGETYKTSYCISLKDYSKKELTQKIKKRNEPMRILAQTDKELLVVYDVEGQNEKTWAGTMQFNETKQYIGFISKEDYFNNKKTFKEIKMIGD